MPIASVAGNFSIPQQEWKDQEEDRLLQRLRGVQSLGTGSGGWGGAGVGKGPIRLVKQGGAL